MAMTRLLKPARPCFAASEAQAALAFSSLEKAPSCTVPDFFVAGAGTGAGLGGSATGFAATVAAGFGGITAAGFTGAAATGFTGTGTAASGFGIVVFAGAG